jgi:hypothetical protein
MAKIVRLTEKDMTRLVKRIIKEQNTRPATLTTEEKSKINNLIKTEGNKVKEYYKSHYSKPETIAKFKNKKNINEIKNFIPNIKFKIIPKSDKLGWVNKQNPNIINLALNKLFQKNGNQISAKGSILYDTILHEMGHLIDFKLESLGEKSHSNSTGYYNAQDGKDNYVQSEEETYTRVQRLREILGLNPNDDGLKIREKLIQFFKQKKLSFPDVKIYKVENPVGLKFIPDYTSKGALTQLWKFYSPIKLGGTPQPDISALFAKYSSILSDKSVFLNLDLLGEVNITTKAIPNI